MGRSSFFGRGGSQGGLGDSAGLRNGSGQKTVQKKGDPAKRGSLRRTERRGSQRCALYCSMQIND